VTENKHHAYNLWDTRVTTALRQIEKVLKSKLTNREKFRAIDDIVQRTANPY